MWVSSDKDVALNLIIGKSRRLDENCDGHTVLFFNVINGYENLTWEDDPVEISPTTIK